ncbi:SERPINE1 mRNA-binding protein 1 [Anabrus simplex]|uniref:SERPINE1 mRNA-binding protein 1 n=1 Tax=Anabrus simplex TaxID=316456 RepID=UPI0035A3336F
MENMYGIGVANRYALFLEIEDPLEILKVQEQEKEAKKKTKLSEKENKGKPENKSKTTQIAKKGIKEAQNVKTLDSNKLKDDDSKAKFTSQPALDKNKDSVKYVGETRDDRNNAHNKEDKTNLSSGEINRDNWDNDIRDRGQGWETGGRTRGFRGGARGGGRRVYENRNRRDFDRQSRSDKTGVKPVDKRDGGGAHNWGNPRDEITEELNPPLQLQGEQEEEWALDDTSTGEALPVVVEPAVFKEVETSGDGETENENSQPTEEEPRELTLDEYYAMRGNRQKPTYNLRKPGEGEDPSRWKKMYVLKKKIGDDQEDEEPDEYDASEYPQRVGRQKYLLDIDIRFADSPRGRGRGRGGPRGGGRGTPRGRGFGGGNRSDRPFRGGDREVYPSRTVRQSAPKVDDEHDFPSLD